MLIHPTRVEIEFSFDLTLNDRKSLLCRRKYSKSLASPSAS
jgi:hypothetical protein